jgi:coenzyme F420-reducing hydrogenase delta subunit/heterodisulfide reductase subunit C
MTAFKRLEKWADKLDTCIRCGYCFEHCPIYKSTGWETDAPRAKLMLLNGLLHGGIEPSTYIAEKMFECFQCKQCESSCSSNVPLMRIFRDARLDLDAMGYKVQGTTSVTDHGKCARCLDCLSVCNYEARTFDKKVLTDPLKCKGCGTCMEVCSGKAITLYKSFGTNPSEQLAVIDEFLLGSTPNPKAIIMGCNWSMSPGFQPLIQDIGPDDIEIKILVTMCAGRIKSEVLLHALEHGAQGILVSRCPEDDCEHRGSVKAKRRVRYIQNLLKQINIEPERIKLVTIDKSDQATFEKESALFLQELKALYSRNPSQKKD